LQTIIGWVVSFGILEFVAVCLVAVNLHTLILYVINKRKAERNDWRISEPALIFFTLALGGVCALLDMKLARHKISKKFKVAVALGLLIAFVPISHIAHGLTLDRIVRFAEIPFHSESWPPELDGYRIAFMSDFHTITDEEMRRVATELNERDIDLLLLGGDFSMRDGHYQGTLREIAQVTATDGIFGVEGNHDNYRRLFARKRQLNITPLDNSGLYIRGGFFLAGVQDAWSRNPSVADATAAANDGDFVLLLSHNPDVSMRQGTSGINLILSGHTHRGQITFFGIPLYLLRGDITAYGMRFGREFAESADGASVFTSSGVGAYYDVPRIFARPEVAIFTMHSGYL